MRHTPGPWHVGMKPGPMIYGPNGEWIADMTAEFLPPKERTADARLIAAAPELLEAVKDAQNVLDDADRTGKVSDAVRICLDHLTALLARLEDV